MQEAADAQEDARDAVRKQLQALTAEFRSARSQTRDASLSIKCAAPPPRLRSVQKAGDLHRTTSAASILPAQRALALHGVRTRQRLTRCRLRQGAGAQRDGRHARGWACLQAAAAPGGRCQGDRRAGGAGKHRGGAGAAAAARALLEARQRGSAATLLAGGPSGRSPAARARTSATLRDSARSCDRLRARFGIVLSQACSTLACSQI